MLGISNQYNKSDSAVKVIRLPRYICHAISLWNFPACHLNNQNAIDATSGGLSLNAFASYVIFQQGETVILDIYLIV